jgi:hypothetical protein
MTDLTRADTLPADVYELLNHPLRRRLLVALLDHEEPVDVDDLAAALADAGSTGSVSRGRSKKSPRELAVALHHVHLPRLAERGWLDHDPAAGTVRYRSRLNEMRAALDAAVADIERLQVAVAAETPDW